MYLQWGIDDAMGIDPLQLHLILELLPGSYSSCFLACVLLCIRKHEVMPRLCPSLQTSRHPGCALPQMWLQGGSCQCAATLTLSFVLAGRAGIMNLSLSIYEALKAKRCARAELGGQAGM